MGKNLEITRRTEDGEYRRVLKWKEVAQRLRLLVYNDQYLTDAEKAPYQAWAAEQQAARAANDAALDHAKHAITDFCENKRAEFLRLDPRGVCLLYHRGR